LFVQVSTQGKTIEGGRACAEVYGQEMQCC
jgi:hypothetical protein